MGNSTRDRLPSPTHWRFEFLGRKYMFSKNLKPFIGLLNGKLELIVKIGIKSYTGMMFRCFSIFSSVTSLPRLQPGQCAAACSHAPGLERLESQKGQFRH